MNSHSFPHKRWRSPGVWVVFHLVLLTMGFVGRDMQIDTSFFSILPAASDNPILAAAESRISDDLNNRVRILVGHQDFSIARGFAAQLAAGANSLAEIESVEWETPSSYDEIRNLVHRYRFRLLGREDRKLLEEDGGLGMAQDALARVFSPVSIFPLDRLNEDPFFLTDRILQGLIDGTSRIGGNLTTRDGVLAADYEGKSWVQVSLSFIDGSSHNEGIEGLTNLIVTLEAGRPGTAVLLSGFPLHNAEASQKAAREISIISMVSFIILSITLLLVFRSPIPWLASLGMIFIAAVTALASTLVVFGRIHLFALVFGTSLIGICIDYALHFFVARQGAGGRGWRAISLVFSSLGLGMLTTVLSFLALVFAAIPLLRQISVFSIVGLISAFLTVMIIFPRLPPGRGKLNTALGIAGRGRKLLAYQKGRRHWRRWSAAVFFAVSIFGIFFLEMDNDVSTFYSLPERLAESEYRVNLIAGGESLSRYFIVFADSEEELLKKERSLGDNLDRLEAQGFLLSWVGVSRFVPTLEEQEESLRMVTEYLVPHAATQFASLGFADSEVQAWSEALSKIAGEALVPSEMLSIDSLDFLSKLWLGQVEDQWASVVIPFGYDDYERLAALAVNEVYWNDSVRSISGVLQRNSRLALFLVAAAYVVIFFVLAAICGLDRAGRIIILPLAAGLVSAGLHGWMGVSFNLFSVFGLILSLGIGIDYSIFVSGGRHDPAGTFLAIALSCLSTLLSFGALSLSSFPPVADFGRAVLIGVLVSFLLAPWVEKHG